MSVTDFEHRPYRLGVGAVVFNGDGQVFVARRIDTETDAWQLPQGGIDEGEDPLEAVFREVEEEIGTRKVVMIAPALDWRAYDLPPDLADRVWKGRYRGQRQMWYALRFTGEPDDIRLDASGHPEFDAWRWAPISTLPSLAISFKRQLYADLVAEFGHIAVA